ncbi:glycoside hydrolase family 26 protein [Methylobacterium organophilum]|uniref:GH26 domain-containing protein n=1 Tax=Methylobacterium organophilum TaxID=410 RepID=A0ABQ4T521_METOR|nr:hypothetical protein [Methylobacterium organophilum]GJE26069.1 hypothetical protein LKMONMHP_0915 [Methylobacterium organophilum]
MLSRRHCLTGLAAGFALAAAPAGMPPCLAGAFTDWGAEGRETTLSAWEAWLSQPPASVPALDFYGDKTWEDFRRLDWLPAFRARANPKRALVWSVPLTMAGTDLAEIGRGSFDPFFRHAAEVIARAQPEATLRIGWEMNVAGSLWLAKGRAPDYIRAYRRVVGLFRQASPRFRFDWCPGWGPQACPADAAYPGDDVVDVIGLDIYDFGTGDPPETRWVKATRDVPFGLDWHRSFARRHGKAMSYPEWGVGQAGDNPLFVSRMAEWFRENAGQIAYALYFDVDGAWPTRLDAERFPQSRAAFARAFAGQTT